VLQHDWPGLQARPQPGTEAAQAFVPIWPAGEDVSWPALRPVDGLGNIHRVTEFFEMRPPVVPVVEP
jgi:hypothetical protein